MKTVTKRSTNRYYASKHSTDKYPDLDYIYHESFDDKKMVETITSPMPRLDEYNDKANNVHIPSSVPHEFRPMYRYPILDKDQEAHLFRQMNFYKHWANKSRKYSIKKYNDYRTKAIEVQKILVASNYRLVINIVKRFPVRNQEFFDTVGDYVFPLINSVVKFDFSLGYKFSTYASWSMIRWKYRRKKRTIAFRTNTDYGLELCAPDEISTYDNNEELGTLVDEVKRSYCILDDREKEILELRFGLGRKSPSGNDAWTLGQIGDIYGISKERARQLQRNACCKLRDYHTTRTHNHGAKKNNKDATTSGGVLF